MPENDESDYLLEQINANRNRTFAGDLIVKLNAFNKKPSLEVELSDVLKKYLQHLGTSQIFLNNGIFTTNFAEGALLLQSATALYAKKVDLLWDSMIMYQERMILYEEKTEVNKKDFEKVEERKERYKRKRKKKEVVPEQPVAVRTIDDARELTERMINVTKHTDQQLLQLLAPEEDFELNLPGGRYNVGYFDWWSCVNYELDLNCPIHIENYSERRKKRQIITADMIEFPNPNMTMELKQVNRDGDIETLCNFGEMEHILLTEHELRTRLKKHLQMGRTLEDFDHFEPVDHVLNLFVVVNGVPIKSIYHEADKFFEYVRNYIDNTGAYELDKDMIESLRAQEEAERSHEEILEQNTNIIEEPAVEREMENLTPQAHRKTVDSRSDDSGFFDRGGSEYSAFNSGVGGNRSTPFTPCQLLSPLPECDETGVVDTPTSLRDSGANDGTNLSIVAVEERHNYCKRIRKRKLLDQFEEIIKKERVKRPRFRCRPTTTTELSSFEMFFFKHYQTEMGEGTPIEPHFSNSVADDDLEDTGADVEPNFLPPPPEPQVEATTNNEGDKENQATEKANTQVQVENGAAQSVSEEEYNPISIAIDLTMKKNQKYFEWETYITEKIGNEKDANFDIHEEGTRIIQAIGTLGNSIKYDSLCKGKTPRDVCRSFISMLQLANTENIEIMNTNNGFLANDTLELKLLSTERQHENLYDYQAPSEVTFRDRLKKARRTMVMEAQPGPSGVTKRTRLG